MSKTRRYPDTFRRMLLDMHIPDWDDAFLSQYDPEALAELYRRAGVEGVLLYCKSHLGLNYWPAPVGGIHRAAQGRDLVGELTTALRERGIAPAAYHSVVYDNWAIEHHPEWSVVPETTVAAKRYGIACINRRAYRDYEREQITALLTRYEFDAFWIDMAFWPAVCVCEVCRTRFREEDGLEIPAMVDWSSPTWARFQAARERWLHEFTVEIIEAAHAAKPGIPVTHNFGPAVAGWYQAQKTAWANLDAFAAGDLYGGRDEQLMVSKLLLHLGERQPAEFMTSRTSTLNNHTALKSEHMMLVEALGTIAHHSAFLFIDAIDPVGTVNDGAYARVATAYAAVEQYEQYLGGNPVEDIAVYYSDDSRVLLEDSGKPVSATRLRKNDLRHVKAVTGAAGKLQRAQLPFGVITSGELDNLNRYRVVVLPDALRLSEAEVSAFRTYVANGGRLYASGSSGLFGLDGRPAKDFPLADVFGCHLESIEDGNGIYVRAADDLTAQALAPERYLGHGLVPLDGSLDEIRTLHIPRLSEQAEGTIRAALTVPYAYPSLGSISAHDFASIHSSPPWQDLANPVIVGHGFGSGRAVFSAAPVEAGPTEADARLFVALVKDLLEQEPSVSGEADPDVWITAFDQPDRKQLVLSALAYRTDARPPAQKLSLSFQPPAGARITRVRRVGHPELTISRAGERINIELDDFDLFTMIVAEYER